MLRASGALLSRLSWITAKPLAQPTMALSSLAATSTLSADQVPGGTSWRWQLLLGAAATAAGLSAAASTPSILSTAQADAASPLSLEVPTNPYQRPTDLQGLPTTFTLYQYEVCPFCCKVKAVLDYCKLPYKVVEVNPLTKGELKWSTYRKVPVLQWGEQQDKVEVDSSAIMSRVAAEVAATARSHGKAAPASMQQPRALPSPSGAALAEEEKWRRWVDERLVKVITANIYRSWDESKETFKYITTQTNWSWGAREAARWSGALLMWQVGKRMPTKYNIQGDLREALYVECNAWVDAVGPKPFFGGDTPGLADLSVYGVLKAVWHTPTFEAAMVNSRIKPWYDRMEAAIGASSRTDA